MHPAPGTDKLGIQEYPLQQIDFVTCLYEFVILIFSLCVHESAHAWMASRLGDQTARMQGRVSLNPAAHVDPIGTLLFPAIGIFGPLFGLGIGAYMIGWAKPVMINPRFFRKITRDDNLVSMAGPASNFLLAILAFLGVIAVILVDHHPQFVGQMNGPLQNIGRIFFLTVMINLSLCYFNLLPIPPLDGSHVVRNMLPYSAVQVYDRLGYFSYLILILIGGRFVSFFMEPTLTIMLRILYAIPRG